MRERLRKILPERARPGAYLLLVLVSGALAAWFGSRFLPRDSSSIALPVSGGGVTLSRVSPDGAGRGPSVQAAEGDWLLETDGLSVVVGSDASGVDRQLGHGALLDAFPDAIEHDALFGVSTVALIAGRELPLRTLRVEPIVEGGRPALRVAHTSRDNLLRLSTFVRLGPGRRFIELTTVAENRGSEPIRALGLGDRVVWPGTPTFAPRLGFVEAPAHDRVPFIARAGRDVSYALAFEDGADVDFRFDRIGPTEQLASSRATDLAPGASLEHRRALVVARGGLASVAEHAYAFANKPFGRVRGKLSPAPAWATLQAEHDDGKPVLIVSAAKDGSFDLPLPAGRYRILSVSPGGEDRAGVIVEPGKIATVRLVPPDPGTLSFEVTDDKRRPLAVRWLVRGIPPTKTPFFGPVERATGAGHGGYSDTGSGRVELPPGRYAFLLTHGVEYAIFEKDVTISAERGETLRATLPRRVDTPGFIACDFHVHAEPSPDSTVTLDDRVRSLIAEGIEFAVATDHNHITSYAPAIDRLRATDRIQSTPGIELTTTRWGHFNAYPYPPSAPLPPHADIDPGDMFAAVRDAGVGALIQVNHPRMPGIGYFNYAGLDASAGVARSPAYSGDFDVLEVMNGFDIGDGSILDQNLAEWFALLRHGRRYTAVGNSDSHRLSREWVGYPRTYVQVNDDDPARVTVQEIVDSLKAGRAVVSGGPFVTAKVQGKGPGELASAEDGRVTLQVSVRAPAWIDVSIAEAWLDGERVATQRATAPAGRALRLAWQTQIPVQRDGFVVVVVRGERVLDRVLPGSAAKPFAFTNPIWIDADGDGFDAGVDAGADAGAGAAPGAAPDASLDAPSPDAAPDAGSTSD